MKFNEDSRVKIPTILHLMQLGYKYISLKDPDVTWDDATNIFTTIFDQSIKRINPALTDAEAKLCLDEVTLSIENEDLGKAFYEKLTATSGVRLGFYPDFTDTSIKRHNMPIRSVHDQTKKVQPRV
ncbi:hypothetical protein [Idiomarina sp.]|uniref:hypothetical protein n=1 Tax=Idiomarina sp. TaxID=1874361 RepID=UPI003A9063C4